MGITMELSKAQRMLLGLAIGDAFGAGFENVHRGSSRLSVQRPYRYPGGTGIYTDDTQMSLAVAEHMASDIPFAQETLASHFVYAYRRDKRNGYSSHTKGMLGSSWCGMDLINAQSTEERSGRRSDGSAMRAVPIGLFPDLYDVVEFATINSIITHAHPSAVSASIGVALASHYTYYNLGSPEDIIGYVRQYIPPLHPGFDAYLADIDDLDHSDVGRILGRYADYGAPYDNARPVLGVVLFILKYFSSSLPAVIEQCIGFGGDVDTTMCMAMGIAMMHGSIDADLQVLIDDLENGHYGRDHLLRVGHALAAKYPSP
jgi:ADP-ribosylglycohydrolase